MLPGVWELCWGRNAPQSSPDCGDEYRAIRGSALNARLRIDGRRCERRTFGEHWAVPLRRPRRYGQKKGPAVGALPSRRASGLGRGGITLALASRARCTSETLSGPEGFRRRPNGERFCKFDARRDLSRIRCANNIGTGADRLDARQSLGGRSAGTLPASLNTEPYSARKRTPLRGRKQRP